MQPDLSGNPFLWLEKPWQKDWERKADQAAQKLKILFLNQRKYLLPNRHYQNRNQSEHDS